MSAEIPIAPEAPPSDRDPVKLRNDAVLVVCSDDLYAPADIGLDTTDLDDENIKVVAEIGIPDESRRDLKAAIVSTRKNGVVRFMLLGLDDTENGTVINGASLEVPENGSILFGRSRGAIQADALWPGQSYADKVSRKQLTLTHQGTTLAIEDTSTNATNLRVTFDYKPPKAHVGIPENVADHTRIAHLRAEEANLLTRDENGKEHFAGRPTIGRDTFPIEGHVDIRAWQAGGEATVVDSKNKIAAPVYAELKRKTYEKLPENSDDISEYAALNAIYETVLNEIEYDLKYVDDETERLSQKPAAHRKANLSNYLGAHKGVCRQMALATAWLAGEMVQDGLLGGIMTAEVNQEVSTNDAHEWARYTAPDGEVYILDAAQEYIGTLRDIINEDRLGEDRWDYFRTGERALYLAGGVAVDNR